MPIKIPDTYHHTHQYNCPIEVEKTTMNEEHEEMTKRMRSLEQNLKNMQGLGGHKSVLFKDLSMFLDVHLPIGFKHPKLDKYSGHSDPVAHLKKYCNQLRGAGGREELLKAYFGESLICLAS